MSTDRGLEESPAFVRYQARLRETWPADDELAAKHGVAAGTGQFYNTEMSKTQSGETDGQLYESNPTRRQFVQGTAAAAAIAATAGTAAAQDSDELELAYSSDLVANPYLAADVTVGTHKASYDSALMYENDNGEDVSIDGVIDTTDPNDSTEETANLYAIRADRVAADAYTAFPRDTEYDSDSDGETDTAVTAMDATHWTTDESNTSGSLTLEDGGGEVNSVRMAASSIASGEYATATFDLTSFDASITSDEDKRHLQMAFNVDALTSGSVVSVKAIDEDGDYKEVTIDPSGDTSNTGVVANATGSGYVSQVQFADLSLEGSGSGTWNNIESVEVRFAEADATVELFGLDLERKSTWEFGEYVENENTDDEETVTVTEPGPDYQKLTGLSTGILETATIYDLQIPVKMTAAESDEGGQASSVSAENYPQFDKTLEQIERLAADTAIDLSFSNLVLKLDQTLPTERFHAVDLAESTADTDDPEDMSWTDVSGSLGGSGTTAELKEFPTAGTQYAVRIKTVLTSDEFDTATSPATGGAGAGPVGSSGGWFSGPRAWLTVLVSGIVGALGLNSWLGGAE